MTYNEARDILNRHCQILEGKEASTNKVLQQEPQIAAREVSWWSENQGTTPDWRNERTVAYFCAYVEIAGRRIPLVGINLDDGFLWPDRAVMRSLKEKGCVRVEGQDFVVTDAGELLLAPHVKLDGDVARVDRR